MTHEIASPLFEPHSHNSFKLLAINLSREVNLAKKVHTFTLLQLGLEGHET